MDGRNCNVDDLIDKISDLEKENTAMKEFIQNLYDDTSTNGYVPLYVIERLKDEVGRMGGIL